MRGFALLLLVAALPAQAVLRLDTGEGVVDLYGKSYALVIGASDYKYWPKLPGVKRDVQLVKAALEKHGFAVTTYERSEGLGRELAARLGPLDSLLVVSTSGRNAVPVELAEAAAAAGLLTIAITTRGPGNRLAPAVAHVLDMVSPPLGPLPSAGRSSV